MSENHEPADGTPTRSRTVLIAAVVAAVLVVVIVIFLATRGDDDPASSSPGTQQSPSGSTAPSPTGSASGSPSATPSASPGPSQTTPSANNQPVNPKRQRVRFNQTATPRPGVDLTIAKVEAVTGKAEITGEVSGPALRLTVQVTNRTQKPVSIDAAVTNLYYGPDRRPAGMIMRPGSEPLPARVAPGKTVQGRVVFTVPANDRSVLQLEVNLNNAFKTVEFNGACPRDC